MCIRKAVKKVVTGKVWVKEREKRGGVEGRPFAKGAEGGQRRREKGGKGRGKTVSNFELHLS